MITLPGTNGTYRFDPLHTASRLGQGGMGVVFRGEDVETGRAVAVKVLYRELTARASHVERARREAAIQIRHENLLEMLDFVELNGIYHSVSEFLEGETLARRLDAMRQKGEFFSLEEIKRIGEALLSALEALHTHHPRIIHRDVDPSNLMLCADGRIKLMDFGVVKLNDGVRKSLTGLGTLIGKPHYSAPEQIRNRPGDEVDESTDLYAAGITIYELLTGQVPFDAPNEYDLMQLQVQNPLPKHARLSREAFSFLQKATAKDQRRRYRSATHMRRALLGLPTGPVLPPPPPLWKRRPVQVAAVTLPVLLMLGGLFFVNRAAKKARYLELCTRAEGFRARMKFDSAARLFGEALRVWKTDSIRSRQQAMEHLPSAFAALEQRRYNTARSLLAADTSDPTAREAFFYLGRMLLRGQGDRPDSAKANDLFQKSARLGYAPAQASLGHALVNGWRMPVDFAAAERWYRLVLTDTVTWARGDALYGLYYIRVLGGHGLTPDQPLGLSYLRAAAHAGSLEAMHRLGVKFRAGETYLPQNLDSARYWLRRASLGGHAQAGRDLRELNSYPSFGKLFNAHSAPSYQRPRRNRASFWEQFFGRPRSRR